MPLIPLPDINYGYYKNRFIFFFLECNVVKLKHFFVCYNNDTWMILCDKDLQKFNDFIK